MSSDEISLNPQLVVFQNDDDDDDDETNNNLRYNCGGGGGGSQRRVGSDPGGPKMFSSTTSSSIDRPDRFFPSQAQAQAQPPQQTEFRRNLFSSENRDPPPNVPTWHTAGPTDDDDSDDDDEDDDDDDEDEDDDDDVDDDDHRHHHDPTTTTTTTTTTNNNDSNNKIINSNNNSISVSVSVSESVNEKVGNGNGNGNGNGKAKHHSTFVKDGSENNHSRMGNLNYGNAVVTVAEQQPDGDMYYSQFLQAAVPQGSTAGGSGHKDLVVENGCGFSGRRDVSLVSTESGDSLRAILSDPVTGALMDDAMILRCGHSFGGGGVQTVIRMKACYTCSQSVSEDLMAPNLSLRAAVQAFRREDELQFYRSSKRRRERFDQDKGSYGDSTLMDPPRGRGVQFPFTVTDRVIIKGNKRTPPRFVGREAVVTTQCLNGWYVVKTLDNAESVKLQYRSLAKVSDDPSKPMSSKMVPNWL